MRLHRWVLAVLLVAAWPLAAAAQTDSGRISGIVTDQSAAFVEGASVTAKNEKTGETRTATTNNRGYFVLTPLKPSAYVITVEKSGFSAIEYTNMPVAI